MRPFNRTTRLILVVCLFALQACKQDAAEEAEDEIELAPVPVSASVAATKDLRPLVDLVGVLIADPRRTATLSSRTIGHIQSVNVTIGDQVAKNATIVSLDPTLLKIARDAAQAQVKQSESIYQQLLNGPRPEQIAVADKVVEGARAAASSGNIRFEAAKKLLLTKGISSVRVAELGAEMAMLDANVATAKARLTLLQAGSRKELIAGAKATMQLSATALKRAQANLNWTKIVAPIKGTVIDILVRPGADVIPSMTLARIVDLSTILVEVRLPAGKILEVLPAAKANIEIPGLSSLAMAGSFDRIVGNADSKTGAMVAWITIPNPNLRLHPGLTCRAELALEVIAKAICVPRSAISDRLGQAVVTVVRDGKAYEIPVETGARVGPDIQILKGVTAGDIVVTEGGYGLPDGCPVAIRQ